MPLVDTERERQRLSELYAGMSEDELRMVADDAGSLTEVAVQALSAEV